MSGTELARHLFSALSLRGDEILGLSAAFPDQIVTGALVAAMVKKRFPAVTVLLGGAAVSAIDVDELLRAAPQIDHVFRGEGEAGLAAFLGKAPFSGIRGLSYRENGGLVHNALPTGLPLEELPLPDLGALPVHQYLNPEPVAPVAFSRGCRWRKCRFCAHNASFGGYRSSGPAAFAETLAAYRYALGIRCFYFADQYIGADDLLAVSEAIMKKGIDLRFQVMGRPTADYTKEVLGAAFEAGCRWISWGVESFSQALLDACNKGTEAATVVRVLKDSAESGISNLAMMIFGLPGSSHRAFEETLDAAGELGKAVDAYTSSRFQLFEGTPFFNLSQAHGLVPLEREVVFRARDVPVHSLRRAYVLKGEDGRGELPRAETEVSKWKQWQAFVRGGPSFLESLPAEHYLLHVVHRRDESLTHGKPTRPASPRPLRRAG